MLSQFLRDLVLDKKIKAELWSCGGFRLGARSPISSLKKVHASLLTRSRLKETHLETRKVIDKGASWHDNARTVLDLTLHADH
jgi:hypothetical protein